MTTLKQKIAAGAALIAGTALFGTGTALADTFNGQNNETGCIPSLNCGNTFHGPVHKAHKPPAANTLPASLTDGAQQGKVVQVSCIGGLNCGPINRH